MIGCVTRNSALQTEAKWFQQAFSHGAACNWAAGDLLLPSASARQGTLHSLSLSPLLPHLPPAACPPREKPVGHCGLWSFQFLLCSLMAAEPSGACPLQSTSTALPGAAATRSPAHLRDVLLGPTSGLAPVAAAGRLGPEIPWKPPPPLPPVSASSHLGEGPRDLPPPHPTTSPPCPALNIIWSSAC